MTLELLLDAFERTRFAFDLRERLPARGTQLTLAGLPGSSPAVMLAWLARAYPTRLFTVVATTPSDAERWVTDLQHLTTVPVALYPQRESLGEEEPHYEIAGERAETLAALLAGRLRILVTTARATQERTGIAAGLTSATLRLGGGSTQTLGAVASALEEMGYERVPTVTEVAQFSVRGGIVDVYGFGMAGPARLEWWGDTLESLRGFDLTTQRSVEPVDEITVLPLGGSATHRPGVAAPGAERQTLLQLLPSDTLLLEEAASANAEEVSRAWREAAHHLEVARRLGEEVPSREQLFEAPEVWSGRIGAAARIALQQGEGGAAALNAGFFPPELVDRDIKRLRAMLSADIPTLILCDNEGQLERLDELLNEDGRRVHATLAIGALDGGFVMRSLRVLTDHEIFRRARRLRRTRRYRQAAPTAATGQLAAGDYVVHLDHGIGVYRGIATITVGESTMEVAIVEYEGGDRLNVPLYRLDQLERYRSGGDDGDQPPPGCTSWAGPSGSGCGTRPGRPSRRWRRNCSTSTPAGR